MKKYSTLRFVAGLQIVAGWLLIAGGILFVILNNKEDETTQALMSFAPLLFYGLGLVGVGQLIYVILDIEANTRRERVEPGQPTVVYNTDSVVKVIDDGSEPQPIEIGARLAKLNRRIVAEKKKFMPGRNEDIKNIVGDLAADKEGFDKANADYKAAFGAEIIDHLTSIASAYDSIYWYVQPLAEAGICEGKYPHKLIEKNKS